MSTSGGSSGGSGLTQLTGDVTAGPGTGSQVATLVDTTNAKSVAAAIMESQRTQYSVLDFGAIGDGITDDTAAIQACINAASNAGVDGFGAEVIFPYGAAGIYLISSHIVYYGGNTYRGVGDPTAGTYESFPIIKTKNGSNIGAGATDAMFVPQYWNLNYTSSDQPCRFINLGFDGNKANNTGIADCLIIMGYLVRVVECYFQNSVQHAIHMTDQNKAGTSITGSGPECGFFFNKMENCNGDAFHSSSTAFAYGTDGFFECNLIQNCANGFYADTSSGWLVRGNHIYGITTDAVHCNSADSTRISDNYIEGFGTAQAAATYNGIYVQVDNGPGVIITDNDVCNLGEATSSTPTYNFITVNNASGQHTCNAIIANNVIQDQTGTAKGVGISVVSVAANDINATIVGNNNTTATTASILTNTVVSTTILGNAVAGAYVATNSAGSYSFTGSGVNQGMYPNGSSVDFFSRQSASPGGAFRFIGGNTAGTVLGGVVIQATGRGGFFSAPSASQAPGTSLVLGTSWQNPNSWDVTLMVYLAITANTSLVVSLGVGPATGPAQQTIISGTVATGVVAVPIKVPAGYYALLSESGTGTVAIVGQMQLNS